MNFAEFIRNNIENLLQEWDLFAQTIRPALDKNTLRDHAEALFKNIADDIEALQNKYEQTEKSKGYKPKSQSIAERHGLDRFRTGYRITEVIAEYKFMRAIIIRLWKKHNPSASLKVHNLISFNEALDQQIFDATGRFYMESKKKQETLNNELEQKVERRSQELKDAQAQYLHAEKLSAIGQLSASIAHELNNPLQGIKTILKGVKRRAILEEEDKELLDLAIDETDRLKNLIVGLREFHQPSTGERNTMDVHASLDSLLLLYKSDFKRNKISTDLNYAEGLPLIEVIPDQIKQVFLNLLNNARDACSEKGSGVITISTRYEDQRVAVAIQDTGVGFSPYDENQIFKPFFSTKPKEKGAGLGLSVCKKIIEQNHQGEIRIESAPGKGSTFTILLPTV